MDSVSNSTPRFRFRDHNQELTDAESSEGHTSADSSSIFSNDYDDETQLQSMTAKGVQYFCSELLELKQESDENFQKDIVSNYSAFIVIWKEMEGMENEILRLKKLASSQKSLVEDVSYEISLKSLSEDTTEEMLEEQTSYPSTLKTHTESLSDILDTFLSEHRLDDALSLLEMESEFFQNMQSGEKLFSNQLTSYNMTISEKRDMLSAQFKLVAENPRVSAPELQKALSGMFQLGDNHLATKLLLQYYHSRIASFIHDDLHWSNQVLDVLYLQRVAKYVFSMISQTVRSFVALNGDVYPYPSEVIEWASEEIEVFAACLVKYIASISEVSGRLSTAVGATQIALSYCSLLEKQRIFLQPTLIELIRSCLEDVLQTHIDRLSDVVGIFTSSDNWVLDRYTLPGILTGRDNEGIDRQPDYYFLTNSGRKVVTLFQSVVEEISPLIAMQMESSVLKGLIDLFTTYIVILENAFSSDTADVIQKEVFRIKLPESPTEQTAILVNLSTLMQFSSIIIRNMLTGFHHLEVEIENDLKSIHGIYVRLKTRFLEKFVSNIFCSNAGDDYGPESSINWQEDSTIYDPIPSVPYLELYLELKKLQKFAEEDRIEVEWLKSFFIEVMETTFECISTKPQIQESDTESSRDLCPEVLQKALDVQFLVEIARYGGYLTDRIKYLSSNTISCLGLNPLRDLDDEEWLAKVAARALEKLQELHEKESQEYEHEQTSTRIEESNLNLAQPDDFLDGDASKTPKSSPKSVQNPVLESICDENMSFIGATVTEMEFEPIAYTSMKSN